MGCRPTTPACWWPSSATADYYETVAKGRDAKIAANWVTGDLFAALNRAGRTIADSPVSAAALGKLLDLIADSTISGRIAKEVFEAMVETGDDPAAIVEAKGLRQVTDTGAIDAAVAQVLAANADKVAEYRAGSDKLFGFFVGQVMKAMAGKGNPALVNDTLKRALAATKLYPLSPERIIPTLHTNFANFVVPVIRPDTPTVDRLHSWHEKGANVEPDSATLPYRRIGCRVCRRVWRLGRSNQPARCRVRAANATRRRPSHAGPWRLPPRYSSATPSAPGPSRHLACNSELRPR